MKWNQMHTNCAPKKRAKSKIDVPATSKPNIYVFETIGFIYLYSINEIRDEWVFEWGDWESEQHIQCRILYKLQFQCMLVYVKHLSIVIIITLFDNLTETHSKIKCSPHQTKKKKKNNNTLYENELYQNNEWLCLLCTSV